MKKIYGILVLALMVVSMIPFISAEEQTEQLPRDRIVIGKPIKEIKQTEQLSQVSYGRSKQDILTDLDLQEKYTFRLTYGNRRTFYLNDEQYKIQFTNKGYNIFDSKNNKVLLEDLNVEINNRRVTISK